MVRLIALCLILLSACAQKGVTVVDETGPAFQPFFGGAQNPRAAGLVDPELTPAGAGPADAAKLAADGWTWIRKNAAPRAILYFNHAWLIDPQNGDALAGLAAGMAARGAPATDIEPVFQRGSAAPRGGAERFAVYASYLMRFDRFGEAAAMARKALALEPDRLKTRLALADALYRSGDADSAAREAAAACPDRVALEGADRRVADAICKDIIGEAG